MSQKRSIIERISEFTCVGEKFTKQQLIGFITKHPKTSIVRNRKQTKLPDRLTFYNPSRRTDGTEQINIRVSKTLQELVAAGKIVVDDDGKYIRPVEEQQVAKRAKVDTSPAQAQSEARKRGLAHITRDINELQEQIRVAIGADGEAHRRLKEMAQTFVVSNKRLTSKNLVQRNDLSNIFNAGLTDSYTVQLARSCMVHGRRTNEGLLWAEHWDLGGKILEVSDLETNEDVKRVDAMIDNLRAMQAVQQHMIDRL